MFKSLVMSVALLALPAVAFAQNADPAAGKKVWQNTGCRACHGDNGEGGFGPDLAGRGLSAAEVQQAVRKPWGIMPAFVPEQVSDADLANLAAYFASLPKVATVADWAVKPTDDMPHAQIVFHDLGCAQCHGPTFDRARMPLGGLNASLATFTDIVYHHTDKMREYEEMLGIKGAGAPPPPPPGRTPPPLRMGNFNPTRVTPAELKEIYDWAHSDLGFRPDLNARLSASGATYTLNLSNAGLKGKGVVAQGVTVDLAIPAGATVVSTTGDGYKGVKTNDKGANVAEWQIARIAPQDTHDLTLTLSKPGTPADNVKGSIRWAKPAPKKLVEAPLDVALPGGGRG